MVTPLLLAAVLAASPSSYEQALTAYWQENNLGAFLKCVEALESQFDGSEKERARYLMSLLWREKLRETDLAQLMEQLKSSRPWLATLMEAREAETRQDMDSATRLLFTFIAAAPDDGWRSVALQHLCRVIDQARAAGTPRPPPSSTKLPKPRPMASFSQTDSSTVIVMQYLRGLGSIECRESLERYFRRMVQGTRDDGQSSVRAELRRLLYAWSGNTEDAQLALREYLTTGDIPAANKLTEELIAASPQDLQVYDLLLDAWSQSNWPEMALTIFRRGLRTVNRSQQTTLCRLAVEACKRQWRYAEAIALLEQTPQPWPKTTADQIRLLRDEFGGRYLPAAALPFKSGSRAVGCRKDGTFLVVEREADRNQVRVVSATGENIRLTRLAEERGLRHSPEQSFGIFPDGTILFRNRRLTDNGQEAQRFFDLPADPWQAAVNETGEVAAVTFGEIPSLFIANASGQCMLSNVVLDAPTDLSRLDGMAFSYRYIYVFNANTVTVFDRDGKNAGTLDLPEGSRVLHVVTDKKGFAYVLVSDRVCVFNAELKRVHEFSCPSGFHALLVDDGGTIYLFGWQRTIKLAPQQGGVWALAQEKEPKLKR